MENQKWVLLKNKYRDGVHAGDYHIETEAIHQGIHKETNGWDFVGVFDSYEDASKFSDRCIQWFFNKKIKVVAKNLEQELSEDQLIKILRGEAT